MKAYYIKKDGFYKVYLDDIYFHLSCENYTDKLINDMVDKLSSGEISLYYKDGKVSVDDVKCLINNYHSKVSDIEVSFKFY